MARSFYHFLIKYRSEQKHLSDLEQFANAAYMDHGFPKNSKSYDEISSYLEMNGHYLNSMAVFDQAWEQYLLEETH